MEQEQNPKQGSEGQVPKQCPQAKLRKQVPEQGPNEQVWSKQAKFPRTGSQERVPKNRFPSKAPKNRFPSKVPINKCQATCPRTVAQARFQEHWTTEYGKVWIVLITERRDWRTSFASRCFYTQKAFEHRCLSTQKHLLRDALTYTRLYTQKLLDTDCFSGNRRSFDTEKPLHRESFTLLHTQAFPQKLLHREAFEHRSFYTQTPLHTEACTHGGLYAQKLLPQRSLYTQTFSHRKTDSTEQLLHSSKNTILRKFLTFGRHIVRKGSIRRWKIAIFDVGQSFCMKGLRLTL